MKNAFRSALGALLLCALFLAIDVTPSEAQQASYPLLTNAGATGSPVYPYGGNYIVQMQGTFGGSTLALTETFNNQTISLGSYTSAPGTAPCFAIPAGAVIQMTVTSGSPSGLYATLGGVGVCPSSGGGGGGGAVTVAGGADVTEGTIGDTQSTGTVVGFLKSIYTGLFGTAGTPSTSVQSVQGISGGTNVPVSQATASALNATVVGAGTAGTPSGGVMTVQGSGSGTAVPVSISGNQATNVAQVNGVTTLTGAGATGPGSQRETVAQDTTTIAGAAPTTTGVYVTGPSAAALATSALQTSVGATAHTDAAAINTTLGTPAQQTGATVGLVAGSAIVGKFGIDQTTPGTTNEVVAVGAAASGASVSGNPLLHGGRAQNAENTAVTNGQAVADARDLTGKEIVAPYANKENFVSGAASATGTGATTIISAPGASVKLYITSLQCFRSDAGTTLAYVTLDDGASTLVALPNSGGGGGSNLTLPVPLVVAANTALTFTASTSLSTVYCQAQGYKGS